MATGAERLDIEFDSAGEQCRGWLYLPDGERTGLACVVMAHGLGATKEGSLDAYAERFRDRGFAVLVFDYRHFGDSDGEPRELIDIGRQHGDWQAAVAYARTRGEVDPERIALWGTSFSGGHVIWVAARDRRVKAVVAQVPHASGPAGVAATGPKRAAFFTYAAIRDEIQSALGRDPYYIPIIGPPGSMATLTTDRADELYRKMYPDDWELPNRGAARLGLRIGAYSPLRDAKKVTCPLLVVIGEDDTITPPGPARKIAERAPQAELITYPGGHFDAYFGETFERVSGAEAEFLERSLVPDAAAAV